MKDHPSPYKSVFYLCDYDFIGHEINGLELINNLHLNKTAILVTSLIDDYSVKRRCLELGVTILPKNFATLVPINILPTSQTTVMKYKPDLILIDDNNFVTDAWEFSAKAKQKNIVIFKTIDDVNQDLENFDREIPIYIDSNLGAAISGEQYAKTLYEKGFKNIYLTTGYKAESFPQMYWIKGIIGKDSIFV